MPVNLAMASIERSISAHRITKVRPTAMMPVTEICVRMLPRLSSVAKEGLAAAKKPNRQISVRNGAMLRIWDRSIAASPRGRFRSVATVTLSPEVMPVSSRRFQQAVLADLFVGKLPHHGAALEHDDAIGDADRDVLVNRLLVEQHVAPALGNEGDPGAAGAGRAAEGFLFSGDRQRALIGLYFAKQDPRQLELAASHKAVDAEHLAGAG